MAVRYPLSWTNHMSPIEAGTRASIGAIQNPWTALAAANDAKLFASAAQKQVTIRPIEVAMYMGRLPIFTARVLQIRLDMAIAAMQEPCRPRVNVWRGMSKLSARGTMAEVKRGPIATKKRG